MRFIENGPDIPEELLYAQEKGELVLFCGAGISVYAGLPNFKDLVNKVYVDMGIGIEKNEEIELKNGNYDRVLGLIENRITENATDLSLTQLSQCKFGR